MWGLTIPEQYCSGSFSPLAWQECNGSSIPSSLLHELQGQDIEVHVPWQRVVHADLAVQLHGCEEGHLEDVAAHTDGGADGGVQQQRMTFGPQVCAQLGCQRLPRLLQSMVHWFSIGSASAVASS